MAGIFLAEEEYTRTGKRKRASYEMVANWVSSAWKSISSELIIKSFVGCGLNNIRTSYSYHSRLSDLLLRDFLKEPQIESTGCTDDEEDDDYEDFSDDSS